MSGRPSFTALRRRRLARVVSTLERLESKNSIGDLSNPLGLAYQAIAGAGLAALLSRWTEAQVPRVIRRVAPNQLMNRPSDRALPSATVPISVGSVAGKRTFFSPGAAAVVADADDWLVLARRPQPAVVSAIEPNAPMGVPANSVRHGD